MNVKYFLRWDWEYDRGIDSITPEAGLPANYAIALLDFWGRLYRVVEVEGEAKYIYDYFCNDHGQVIEKRAVSFEDPAEISLLVRYKYEESGVVNEQAWYPDDPEQVKVHNRSQYTNND